MPSDASEPTPLSDLYAQAKGAAVAFIDESYRSPSQAIGGNSFYVLTAVLFPRLSLDAVRSQLEAAAGAPRWHTTEAALTAAGMDRITMMVEVVARLGVVVVAVQRPIPTTDRTAETARMRCFEVLLGELCRTGSLDPRGLVVFEKRRDSAQQKADNAVINGLRRDKTIPETLYVMPATPSEESLLWAADVASWSLRRAHTHEDHRFIGPVVEAKCLHRIQANP